MAFDWLTKLPAVRDALALREAFSAFTRRRDDEPAPAPARSPFDDVPQSVRPTAPARDLPITTATSWDNVQTMRAALTRLEQGTFADAALLLDAMLGDSHVAAKLEDRLSGLFGSPFSMAAPKGKEADEAALAIAADAELMWDRMISDGGHRLVARDGIMLGAGLGEVRVTPGEKEWQFGPLKHWHARHLWWNWGTRTFWINSMRGSEELKPDGRGGYFSTWRDETGATCVTRWVLYTPYGYQRGWVNGRIKAIALPWLLRNWAWRDWGRHSEVLGIPPRKVKVPSEWDDGEKRRALREVTMLASESIIMCPQKPDGYGFDVELLELKGTQGPDVFDKLRLAAESAITVTLVGQALTTQTGPNGNRSVGEVGERVTDKIRASDAGTFSRSARAAIVVPWCEATHGDIELAPAPTWAVQPPEDLKTKGDGLKAVGDGIASLKSQGIPVDRARICGDAGIPLEEGREFEEPRPPADPCAIARGAAAGQDDGDEGRDEPPPGSDPEPAGKKGKKKRKGKLSARVALGRSRRGAAQGQAYVDALADEGRRRAARLLAGNVKALQAVLKNAKAKPDGTIDGAALKADLLAAYKGMKPDELAHLLEKLTVLAKLQGKVAVLSDL